MSTVQYGFVKPAGAARETEKEIEAARETEKETGAAKEAAKEEETGAAV